MSSPQDKYADAMRTSQAAVVAAFESWTKSAQRAIGAVPGVGGPVEPQQVIDQVFDFAVKMLACSASSPSRWPRRPHRPANRRASRPNRWSMPSVSTLRRPPRWSRTP